MIKGTVRTSELNSFASIRACRPWQVISAQTWLATILILFVISKCLCGVRLFGILAEI